MGVLHQTITLRKSLVPPGGITRSLPHRLSYPNQPPIEQTEEDTNKMM